jgi:hypothetical protein
MIHTIVLLVLLLFVLSSNMVLLTGLCRPTLWATTRPLASKGNRLVYIIVGRPLSIRSKAISNIDAISITAGMITRF